MLTIAEARAALTDPLPADVANVTTVQDARARLRDSLELASHGCLCTEDEPAPNYVAEPVRWLANWIDHARQSRRV